MLNTYDSHTKVYSPSIFQSKLGFQIMSNPGFGLTDVQFTLHRFLGSEKPGLEALVLIFQALDDMQ